MLGLFALHHFAFISQFKSKQSRQKKLVSAIPPNFIYVQSLQFFARVLVIQTFKLTQLLFKIIVRFNCQPNQMEIER